MKKFFNTLFVIIVAMVTFAACVKEENAPAFETQTVQFFAESIQTKTHFGDKTDEGKYLTLWDAGDKVKVFLNLTTVSSLKTEETVTVQLLDPEGTSAKFKTSFNDTDAPSYAFYAVSPASAFVQNSRNEAEGKFSVDIKSTQVTNNSSVDKEAQVLYAKSVYDEWPTESVAMQFSHLTAYGKFSLVNLTDKVTTVNNVTIHFDAAVVGKFDCIDGTLSPTSASTNEITVIPNDEGTFWFACAPADVAGQTASVIVDTDKGLLKTDITFPAGASFKSAVIASFGINMKDVEPAGGELKYYEKVVETPQDWSGTYLVVYEATPAYWDASLGVGTSAGQMGSTAGMKTTSIVDNKILSTEVVDASCITIQKSGTGYALKAASGNYMGMSSNNNGLKSSTKATDYVHTITLESNKTVSILSSDEFTKVAYNKSSSFFRYYKVSTVNGAPSSYPLPCLYKLASGSEDPNPTPEPEPEPEPETPVYASLTELVEAGAPTENAIKVTVTLTNEEITGIYTTNSGYRNGVFLQVGNREIEIYCRDVPEIWVVGGTLSGTLTECDWKLYNTTWELCPADWSELTYAAPEGGTTPDPEQPGEGGGSESGKQITVTTKIANQGWENSKQYSTLALDDIISASASGSTNTGKYYTNGDNWRFYQNENATLTISAVEGYTINTVKIEYTVSNTGVLTHNNSNIATGTVVEVNASSIQFGVGNTGTATNGQVRITAIEVVYQAD